MRRTIRMIQLLAFVVGSFVVILVADVGQTMAESALSVQEERMAEAVNLHRGGHRLVSLKLDPALQIVARRQAQRMTAAGYIYHNPDLGAEAGSAVPDSLLLGENVAVGASVLAVQEAFLRSPGHHRNIDDQEFRRLGVGTLVGDDGLLYFAQIYSAVNSDYVPQRDPFGVQVLRTSPEPSPGTEVIHSKAGLGRSLFGMLGHALGKLWPL